MQPVTGVIDSSVRLSDKGMTVLKSSVEWALEAFISILILSAAYAADASPDHAQAVVSLLEGKASAFTAGEKRGASLKRGDRLTKDQEVRVADKSRIEIRFPDGTVMRLSEKSTLKLNDVYYSKKSGAKTVRVGLSIGKLWAKVRGLTNPDSRVEVRTVNAVAGVRGTVYRVNMEKDKSAVIKVYDGSVYVENPPKELGQTTEAGVTRPTEVPGPHAVPPPYHEVSMEEWQVIVKSFQQMTISPEGKPSEPKNFTLQEDADDWVRWNQERDKQMSF